MVGGHWILEPSEWVRATAIHALGQEKTKYQSPETWKTLFLFGKVIKRNVDRSVLIKWDGVSTSTSVSTRRLRLQREEPEPMSATRTSAVAASASTTTQHDVDLTSSQDGEAVARVTVTVESTDDSEEDQTIAAVAFDAQKTEEATETVDDASQVELLTPHGLRWKKKDVTQV